MGSRAGGGRSGRTTFSEGQERADGAVVPNRSSSNCWAEGRLRGDAARQSSTSDRNRPSRVPRSGSPTEIRSTTSEIEPSPNGGRPHEAYTSRQPHAHASTAEVTSAPAICSGARNDGPPRTPRTPPESSAEP